MKKITFYICLFFIGFSSCEVDEVLNPNSPTIETFENGATLADLQLLAQGLEATIRNDMNFHFWTTSIVAREYLDLRGTDPRYTSELLGQNGGDLDNNGFLTTRSYFGRFRSVRNAILLKTAVANTAASLTPAETNSFLGFANTIIGYEMLLEAVRQHDNGIRTVVDNVDELGPFANNFSESLTGLKTYLDEGYTQLTSASPDFLFQLSSDGFTNISGTQTEAFAKFNRAITARVEMYLGNKAGIASALGDSFMDMAGDMNLGAYYSFGGATGNDLSNLLFYIPNTDIYVAHPSFTDDATANDARLSKVTLLDASQIPIPVVLDGLMGSYQVSLYPSNTSPASIIRNEELILMMAEANIGSNNTAAVTAINVVRNAAGIGDYTGATDDASLEDELLYQRRYSLFGEGHRWADLRRFNRLSEIPLDRAGDKVHTQFPRPASEN